MSKDQDAMTNTYAWEPRTKKRAKAAMADLIVLDKTFCHGGIKR